MAGELIERLCLDLENVARSLSLAGSVENWMRLRDQSHILIALAGAAGADPLQSAAEALNRIAARADRAALEQILPACLSMIAALPSMIRSLPLPGAGTAP